MTRFKILHASLLLAAAAATPAFSQMQMEKGPMASPPSTKASEGHINAMMLCQKMSPQVMMKNKSCAAMMKVHPNMMKMSKGDMNMMKSCQKMSHSAMMGNRGCTMMIKMNPDMMNMDHGMMRPH